MVVFVKKNQVQIGTHFLLQDQLKDKSFDKLSTSHTYNSQKINSLWYLSTVRFNAFSQMINSTACAKAEIALSRAIALHLT